MNKKSLFKESFYATGFILISIYLLSLININSDVVNPISKAMSDFELTDIVFSQLKESPAVDTNIVMVNLGPAQRDRDGLAEVINVLNHYEPKVIAIDAFFRKPRKDAAIDSALVKAFSKVKHLVLVSENHENPNSKILDSMEVSHPMFMQYAEPGFADMITKGRDFFRTSRDCSPKEVSKRKNKPDTTYYSFPVKIASIYAPEKAKAFIARNQETEIINFQGNIDPRNDDVSANAKIAFAALDWPQVLDTLFVPELIKDKIVIIGYMGDFIGHNAWEDKFFTPLNVNYIGKANPDMYGVVVHANIVSMILKEAYIDEMPFWPNLIIAVVLIFLNVWFFSYLYFRTEEWYDGLSLLLTLAEILVLMIIVLIIFNSYNYSIDITLSSVALFLTGNLIEIHFGIVKPTIWKIKGKMKFLNKNKPIFTKN